MSELPPNTERPNPFEKPEGAKSYRITMEGSDQSIELHRANAALYLHRLQSVGDHIFVCVEENEDGDPMGYMLWRETMGGETFEKILEGLRSIGVNGKQSDYMSSGDIERFVRRFGRVPELDDVEIETFELTKRLGELCRHWAEVLERTPDDLLYDAITTPQQSNLPLRWTQSKKVVDEDDSGAY